MACGVGGIISIDFKERTNPAVRRVDFDLASQGYKLLVVNTGGNHADLTDAYAEIPNEMWEAARICGATRCGEITQEALIQKIPEIRLQLGDRAVLRALHFFEENTRVDQQIAALERDDFSSFLRLVHESGSSSWRLLQNCYLASTPRTQPIPSCLAITSSYMKTHNVPGACRVHGGGFAGVIAVFLPRQHVEPYTRFIEGFFGTGCVTTLGIRQRGAGAVLAG
jgi:galactokinase